MKKLFCVVLCLCLLFSGVMLIPAGAGSLPTALQISNIYEAKEDRSVLPEKSAKCFGSYHTDIVRNDYAAPTCTQNGYIGGAACVACGTVLEAPVVIPATHSVGHTDVNMLPSIDVNGDGFCDICGLPMQNNGSHCSVCGGTAIQNGTCMQCGARMVTRNNLVDLLVRLFRAIFG